MTLLIPDTLSMIRALIERPSASSADARLDQSNLSVIQLLADWLETLGFSIEIQHITEQKANLIAKLGNDRSTTGLVLSGHTDTVPCEADKWTYDPFTLTKREGRLYGLGSADMKAFFALVLQAARHYSAKDMAEPLVVLATADEESTMAGARALLERGLPLGRYAIIGEPTGLRPVRMHKGVMVESITINGQAGHSSDPALGANALDGLHAVLGELLVWRSELQSRYRNPLFKVNTPTLNLGSIHGGDNPHQICSHCETQIDIRPLPGMDPDEVHSALEQRISSVMDKHPRLSGEIHPLCDHVPPFETAAEATLVKACQNYSGNQAGSINFATEAPFLSKLGMETVIMGPGSIEQAHREDEYLPLSQLDPTIRLLRKLIDRFCLGSPRR